MFSPFTEIDVGFVSASSDWVLSYLRADTLTLIFIRTVFSDFRFDLYRSLHSWLADRTFDQR